MRRALPPVALLSALALAACGGGHTTTTTTSSSTRSTVPSVAPAHLPPKQAANVLANPTTANRPVVTHDVIVPQAITCPMGHATIGCSVQPTKALPSTAVIKAGGDPPAGPKFPDVSSYQGRPDWAAALHWGIYGAVAKLGEGVSYLDPEAGYNIGQFKALHMRWSVYWFVRPESAGCRAEGSYIVSKLDAYGAASSTGPVVILDEEVPGLAGYATCIDSVVYSRFHRHVAIYTAPGTWSGGSGGGLPAWVASYGPTSPPACPYGCHVAAFQYTDGQFGFPTPIPGIGDGDVSVSYSLFSVTPPKPQTICFGSGSTPASSTCRTVERQAHSDWRQYLAFHNPYAGRVKQANVAKGNIAGLQKDSARVYVNYRGPALGWLTKQLRAEAYWGAHFKALHDDLVRRYTR